MSVLNSVGSCIFSGSNTTPHHNVKWQDFPMGNGSTKILCSVKEESQSSIGSSISKLTISLPSGEICMWACYGSSLDAN